MVHWLLSTTRCKTFALIGRCLRRGVIILQRVVEILQRVVDWVVRPQRPAIVSSLRHYLMQTKTEQPVLCFILLSLSGRCDGLCSLRCSLPLQQTMQHLCEIFRMERHMWWDRALKFARWQRRVVLCLAPVVHQDNDESAVCLCVYLCVPIKHRNDRVYCYVRYSEITDKCAVTWNSVVWHVFP